MLIQHINKDNRDLQDDTGNTPLHLAAKHHLPDVVMKLCTNNTLVSLQPKNKENQTPLDLVDDLIRDYHKTAQDDGCTLRNYQKIYHLLKSRNK